MLFKTIALIAFAHVAQAQTFPTTVPEEISRQCRFNEKDKAAVESCLRDFAANECFDYPSDPAVQSKLASCSLQDIQSSAAADAKDFLKSCGGHVVQSYRDLYNLVTAIPGGAKELVSKFGQPEQQDLVARELCRQELGDEKVKPLDNLPHLAFGPGSEWYACVESKRRAYNRASAVRSNQELAKAFSDLGRNLKCFKKSEWAALGCPLVADLVLMSGAGAAGKFVARESLPAIARGLKSVPGVGSNAQKALDTLASRVTRNQEKRSIAHQGDLLEVSRSEYMKKIAERAGLDKDAVTAGMLDSDVGKLASEWSRLVLTKSKASDSLIETLSGQGKGPAAKAFRELLDESGHQGKTFFPRDLSTEQLREVISKNPVLQSYLHEAPGMSNAIRDFEGGLITSAQFKTRMGANFGHNGPRAGFMAFFDDAIVPGALKNSDDVAKSFFRGTVFEGETTAEGVVKPRYPGAISAEGVFHTFADRLSQGSRGGMMKIFDELGGKTLADNPKILMKDFPMTGLGTVQEMLIGNPQKTLKQLEALGEHTRGLAKLNAAQKQAFEEMISAGRKRMQQQVDYISKQIESSPNGLKITLEDAAGKKTVATLTGDSSATEAQSLIEKLMLQEERLHGNPMKNFPYGPARSGSFYGPVAGAVGKSGLTLGICDRSAPATREAPAVR